MIRAILTRWNTVFDVITRGLELQIALDRLCTISTGRASIKKLLLSNAEWQIMYQLQSVLKVRRFILFFNSPLSFSSAVQRRDYPSFD